MYKYSLLRGPPSTRGVWREYGRRRKERDKGCDVRLHSLDSDHFFFCVYSCEFVVYKYYFLLVYETMVFIFFFFFHINKIFVIRAVAERGKEKGRIVLLYFLLLLLRLKSNRKLIMYKYYPLYYRLCE